MNDPAIEGITITKEYCINGFVPNDLQWNVVDIDGDVTLYDIFRLVYQAEIMVPGIAVVFGMSKFYCFWNQINMDRDPDDNNDVAYLELYWSYYYDVHTTQKTGKKTDQRGINKDHIGYNDNYWDDPKLGEMRNLMAFHGMGPGCPSKQFHECNSDCPRETPYGIEFTSVNNLAHLPVQFSPKVEFYPPFVESDREFKRTGFQLKVDPTLWCFITSIFWELTFLGYTPNAVANHAQEISDRVDGVRDSIKKKDEENNVD